MERCGEFRKNSLRLLPVNYFRKTLYHRCLTEYTKIIYYKHFQSKVIKWSADPKLLSSNYPYSSHSVDIHHNIMIFSIRSKISELRN